MPEITRYPLVWPDNVARTAPGRRGTPRFGNWTVASSCDFVRNEVNRLNNRWHGYTDESLIISTNVKYKADGMAYSNQAEPADPGVAVYFNLVLDHQKGRKRHVVLTCDKWSRLAWNIYAIGKDIEAQRGRLRWGCTNIEQSFRGYLAIPERTGGAAWWVKLGIDPSAGEAEIKEAYRVKALTEHPDKGGTHERWTALQEAFNQAMAKFHEK